MTEPGRRPRPARTAAILQQRAVRRGVLVAGRLQLALTSWIVLEEAR
jgi:hypothetical protein